MRRTLLLVLVVVVALAAQAPAEEPLRRLGVLTTGDWMGSTLRSVMIPELARRGYVEGRNLVVVHRESGGSDPLQLQPLAQELAAAKPDVIVAVSLAAVRAAMAAAPDTPIVTSFIDDPVADGLAVSLSRPTGKVTGVTMLYRAGNMKRLQLLHEAIPTARRFAYLAWPSEKNDIRAMTQAAGALGIELVSFSADTKADYKAAFDAARAAQVDGVVIASSPAFFRDAAEIAALASDRHLPTICEWREMAAEGCLIGYGPNISEMRLRTADFVIRLFAGADPRELPFEQPTHFELAVNGKVARAIGLVLPPALLARADEVIE
jgi:putative ABC transport system substrate-binding protein